MRQAEVSFDDRAVEHVPEEGDESLARLRSDEQVDPGPKRRETRSILFHRSIFRRRASFGTRPSGCLISRVPAA
jgi:hypothetical protein